MALDKITPLAAPPGHSLTDEPGKWPWENPPEYADPDDAIDFVVGQMDTPQMREDLSKLMLAGVTVEELVSQVAFKGFAAGAYTPDVAELIKPAIAIYLLGIADDEGFEAKMFITDDTPPAVSDDNFFAILKERNPELFGAMNEYINAEKRAQELNTIPRPEKPVEPNFLNTQDQEVA
tara:strand:+ start:317 stop:850 length:534 start_codon:yes stop_codon:yes gene_type:complete